MRIVVKASSKPGKTQLENLPSTPIAHVSCPPSNRQASARVLEIIDGNTVKVLMDGLVYVVRYLGMHVPQDEQNAFDAYLENSDLVFRKDVVLIADGADKDSNGRLLRYVFVGDTFVNRQLLQEGLGLAVGVPEDFSCAAAFKAAENSARQSAFGLWAASTPVPTP